MDKYNVKNIVFSSSANTYSASNVQPVNELSPQSTTNPYWTSKFLLEKILEDLSKFSWFNVINLRYFNPIWAHPSWLLWENPEWKPNNLFPFIFKVLLWEIEELNIFWWDYETIDGTWVRDYIDVNDLIDAHLLTYNKLTETSHNGFSVNYNVWTWKGISVLESVNAVEKVVWKKVNYKIIERRNWDVPISFCSIDKIKTDLWFSIKTSLEESIKNSWNFYNKNKKNNLHF